MAFNVNDIKAQLEFGGARPTLFQVQIINPTEPAVKPTARKKVNSNKSLGRELTIKFS